MFYVIRAYRQSWLLLIPAIVAGVFVFLRDSVDDWPEFLDDSITTVVGAATGLLAFILSLNLNTALTRNADGNANFNAFCGDVLAFGMFVCGLTIDDPEKEEALSKSKNNIRDILLAAPQVCKWTFRSGVDVDLIPVRLKGRDSSGKRMSEKLYERNKAMYCLIKEYYDIGAMEAIMLALGNEMQNLTAMEVFGKDNAFHTALIGKWENIYSSYGNLGNIFSYKFPAVLDWLLDICLGIYLLLMPYGLVDAKYHAIWLSFVVAYFFLGLHIVASQIGNPFASSNPNGKVQFATVGQAAEATQRAVEALFQKDRIVGLDNIDCRTPLREFDESELPGRPSGMELMSRERNLELGVDKIKY
tara:strand:+ start:1193 stop:2269 length:1077 start_codon:yes stop_codon:yes gene_type:complete